MVKNHSIPKWLHSHLSPEQVQTLSDLVAQMEQQTSGEIVPVIVHRSSSIGHVPWVLMGFLMTCFWILEEFYRAARWGAVHDMALVFGFFIILVMSFGLSRFHFFQRFLTTDADEAEQVDRRAQLEFFQSHIKKTAQGTGILIFVSWMERRAVILADEGVSKHYPPETWQNVVQAMVGEFKKDRVFEGLEGAIRQCGEILRNQLPPQTHNKNELCNHLTIKE